MTRSAWDQALEDYYAEHDEMLLDADARGPGLLEIGDEERHPPPGEEAAEEVVRVREVRQTIHDPDGHHDWVIEAVVDCDASDTVGELVLLGTAMRRLGG